MPPSRPWTARPLGPTAVPGYAAVTATLTTALQLLGRQADHEPPAESVTTDPSVLPETR